MNTERRQPFSLRQGLRPSQPPISIWDDAPEDFRHSLLTVAQGKCELSPSDLRDIVCTVLHKRPDPKNWSEYPNIWGEVEHHVYSCEWYHVYDIVEATNEHLVLRREKNLDYTDERILLFVQEVNLALVEFGIGWQLKDGLIQARGEEAYEAVIRLAQGTLITAGKTTAHTELQEALKDISRRPTPDATGAIQHAMAALECVARDYTGDTNATLGAILKSHPIIPKPLDQAVDKLWGFASDNARHVREGQTLDRREAQLVVGLAATLSNYLADTTGAHQG